MVDLIKLCVLLGLKCKLTILSRDMVPVCGCSFLFLFLLVILITAIRSVFFLQIVEEFRQSKKENANYVAVGSGKLDIEEDAGRSSQALH